MLKADLVGQGHPSGPVLLVLERIRFPPLYVPPRWERVQAVLPIGALRVVNRRALLCAWPEWARKILLKNKGL